MISSIKKFFDTNIKGSDDRSTDDPDHAISLATAALLIEISRADFEVREEERKAVAGAVQSKFGLTSGETEELISLADKEVRESSSYHEFTSLINSEFSREKKIRVVELLWEVSLADGEIEKHEEHLIRKIADLLHVSHKDFIAAKLKAKGMERA